MIITEEKKSRLSQDEVKQIESLINSNLCMSFVPNGKQKEYIDLVGSGKYFVNVFSAANGVGKTTVGINILCNLLYDSPLNNTFKDFYRNFKKPIKARIISTPTAIESKIVPELKKWLPKKTYKTLKRRKPYEYLWEFDNGSELDILTNEQDVTEFESVEKDIILIDEPSSREIFTASVSRLRQGGIVLITMTPLTGADWMVDRIEDISWGIVYADVEAACKTHGTNGYLEHKDIVNMITEYDPDEREARASGKFMCLSGVIYKSFNRDVHCIKRCKIQNDWVIGMTVDPHPAKPFAMLWWALTPREELIFIDEFPKEDFDKLKRVNWTMEDYANFIREIESEYPNKVEYYYIDPNFARTPDAIQSKTVIEEFADRDLWFDADINDDVTEGIIAVKNRLRYDKEKPISGSNQPTLFIFDDLFNTIKHISKWGYREWKQQKGKSLSERTQDKYKDFSDCIRYTAIKDPLYTMPAPGPYYHVGQRI